ncbi:hypothetical protein U1Q18_025731, partial [Sarracenia purpurea var. burkii]
MWTRSEDCRKIIQVCWEKEGAGEGLEGFRQKCARVGRALSSWNWTTFGHIQRKINTLKERLSFLQSHSTFAAGHDAEEGLK